MSKRLLTTTYNRFKIYYLYYITKSNLPATYVLYTFLGQASSIMKRAILYLYAEEYL